MFEDCELVVIGGNWPGHESGLQLALSSSLKMFSEVFPRTHYIAISEAPRPTLYCSTFKHINWIHAYVKHQSLLKRFLLSCWRNEPAICYRYLAAEKFIIKELRRILHEVNSRNRRVLVIIEDITPGVLVFSLKQNFKKLPVAIRSHNMISQGFKGMDQGGSLLSKIAWCYELKRISNIEKRIVLSADVFWCITKREVQMYEQCYKVEPKGVFGFGISSADYYSSVDEGDILTLVHVGSADLRKGKGLSEFLETGWKLVKERVPNAKFVIAGRNTQQLSDPARGVIGIGKIDDEREVLKLGQVFLNSQLIGAGIKVKSVVAMLSGCALASTAEGVEGIPGNKGVHYEVAHSMEDLGQAVVDLMLHPERAKEIATRGRAFAREQYSYHKFRDESLPVLRSFVVDSQSLGKNM